MLPGVVTTFRECLPRAPALRQVLEAMLAEGALELPLILVLAFQSSLLCGEVLWWVSVRWSFSSPLDGCVSLAQFMMVSVTSALSQSESGLFLLPWAWRRIAVRSHGAAPRGNYWGSHEGWVFQLSLWMRTVDFFPVFSRVFTPGLSWLPLTGFDFASLVDWLILAPRSRDPHSQSRPFSRFVTFWHLCDASWSPPLFLRSLRCSLASCLAALPLPHYYWSRDHGRSSAGLSCWVSALLSAVSWWYRSSCLAQGCVPLLRPFVLLLALWSSVPSGSLLLYIAPSLRDEVTLPGRVCLSPRSQRRLFLHLPGVWSRTFVMRSPLRVESFSGLDRNEDSSRTFPSVLVPSLCDGVALIGPCCVFLHTRSERRLLLPPILYYFAMGSPFGSSVVVLPARSERSLLGIAGRCSFRMGSPFSGPVITTWSRVKEFLELGSWERFSGLFSGWVSSSFDHPVCSEVGEGPTFRCLHLWWGLCLYPSRQQRSGSWTFFFYWPCRLSPSPGGSVCFGGLTVWFLSPGHFMHWPYTHGGSLAAFPEVGLFSMGCWRIVRAPQNLCLTPLPGMRSMLLFFGIAVWALLQATPLTRIMESSPKPGQGLSVSAFKGCSSALTAFSFWGNRISRSLE